MDDSFRKKVGKMGEEIASRFLEEKGFKILARNYRKPWGEIDIIAVKNDTVRFVEVKAVSRENVSGNGSREMEYRPEELVHEGKLKKIARTAAIYMDAERDNRDYQIDVVGIVLDLTSQIARCRLFEQVL